jgi:hypothetical protein
VSWQTRRVTRPIVVERERRSMIGTTWVRRKITDPSDPWNAIRLTGMFDLGNDSGSVECCVTPVTFGPTMTTTAEGLTESYTLKENVEDTQRLSDLLARAASL